MKLKDLFEEYGAIRTGVINCDDEGCKICIEDKERMAEIIKEVEASIRKEVVEENRSKLPTLKREVNYKKSWSRRTV